MCVKSQSNMFSSRLLTYLTIILAFASFESTAQSGYQVTVVDTATCEAMANETVSAKITISDAAGGTI